MKNGPTDAAKEKGNTNKEEETSKHLKNQLILSTESRWSYDWRVEHNLLSLSVNC